MKDDLISIFSLNEDIIDEAEYNLFDVFPDTENEIVDEHRIWNDIFPDDIEYPDEAEYDLEIILQDDVFPISEDEEEIEEEEFVAIEGRLNLTNTEANEISSVSRERKFSFTKSDMLYNKSYVEKANNFINNYRFLISVRNSITKKPIIEKIDLFLKPYVELYTAFLKLTVKISSTVSYGKSSANNNLTDKLLENDDKINKFIDEIYSLGKVVSQYDPDSEIGMV